jgi:hypothetical protein
MPGMDDDARPETALGDPLTTVRRRLAQQRLVGASFERPAEAVHWLGAVQAQEYAEAKWSLGQRTGDCTDADVEAAGDRGEILRTHVLRPTWHFVTPADIRWLLQLTGPRVQARSRSRYAELGLDGRTLVRAHEILHGRWTTANRAPARSSPGVCRREVSTPAGSGCPTCSCPPSWNSCSAAGRAE